MGVGTPGGAPEMPVKRLPIWG